MKYPLTLIATLIASVVLAGCGDEKQKTTNTAPVYVGHPRCTGSYEPEKCEALEAKLAAQTPEERRAASKKLETDRQSSMKEVISKPATAVGPTCNNPKGQIVIGMDKEEVIRCGLGEPNKINQYTNVHGTEEQWIYRKNGRAQYLYFDVRGILTSFQDL